MESTHVTISDSDALAVARGVLLSLSDCKLTLGVPDSDYQIQLIPTYNITTPVGKRIKGTIRAQALRISKANGGGKFIEPIWGEPRIVAGVVLGVDPDKLRLLVDVAIPMWMQLQDGQAARSFDAGDFISCYVESGATFTPC